MDIQDKDELFEESARLIFKHNIGSTSLLQRHLRLGYCRAGRIMEQLFKAGIVGDFNGAAPRKVLPTTEDELNEILNGIN